MNTLKSDLGIIHVAGKTQIFLGRAADANDVALPHPAVSAQHARLELRSGEGWWVHDLHSEAGVFVNNRRVGPEGLPVILERDTLWISPYALRLSESSQNQAPRPAHLRLDIVNLRRVVAKNKILLDLRGTPLSFRPGEFIAIVGGSGAGKSTLLKALLGVDTIPEKGRSGDVYFNNQLLIQNASVRNFAPLNTIIGYVPQQDDSLHFQLTPREALDYTAQLRFAADLPVEERKLRVRQALDAVKLDREELQTRFINQLSGGQRKRVNVAMELVADPRLLFLDEPTSGLDPGLDLEMMTLLKTWATGSLDQDPKTIVLITHATENVRLCDNVVFMGRVQDGEETRGGCVLYFGPPGEDAQHFFNLPTFSEVYRVVENPQAASEYHSRLVTEPQWNALIWEHSRSPQDIEESQALESAQPVPVKEPSGFDFHKVRRQFGILSSRYWKLLSRDRGAFGFQLGQGILVAMLLWGVAEADTFTAGGVRSAPTTLFILSIASAWLGILNAAKEIVKERRVFGRERRYGVGAIPYVMSKFAVLVGLGIWQTVTVVALTVFRFAPESHVGALGRWLPGPLQLFFPLELEWFITLELMLAAGVALGLAISAYARSLDQATMIMFPAMLVQVLLSGLLFDVGPLAWVSFTHWGLQALGNSMDLEGLFASAGKASDPVLERLLFASNGWHLLGYWLVLAAFCLGLVILACWRQSWRDKARIPED